MFSGKDLQRMNAAIAKERQLTVDRRNNGVMMTVCCVLACVITTMVGISCYCIDCL